MTPGQYAEQAAIMVGGLDRSGKEPAAVAQVYALLAVAGQIEAFGDTLTLTARLLSVEHPPVPEQATTAEQAAVIEAMQPLLAGWQPGTWPVPDLLDSRGWRWANPLEGD